MSTAGFRELRVITPAAWLARDLATGTDLRVAHDYGLDAPADTSRTAWWAPHKFIARLAVTPGVTQPGLASPGAAWMTTLDPRWARRGLWSGPLSDVADSTLWAPNGALVFAKVAEIKLGRLQASVYSTAAAFLAAAGQAGVQPASQVVLSGAVAFTDEYRCFVAPGPDGEPVVVASSAYLIGDVTWDFWEDAAGAPDTNAAVLFAQRVLDDPATVGPAGYVIDVGRLADGSWAVVEPNASWSSNPYHCDPTGVVRSILVAQDPAGDRRWAWTSDPAIDRYARPLPVRTT